MANRRRSTTPDVARRSASDEGIRELANVFVALGEMLIYGLPRPFPRAKKLISAILIDFVEPQSQRTNGRAFKLLETATNLNNLVE